MALISGGGGGSGGGVTLYDYTVTSVDKASIDTGVDGTIVSNFAGYPMVAFFMLLRTDDAGATANPVVTVNNDTSALYDRQVLAGVNATASATLGAGNNNWALSVNGSGGLASAASGVQIWMPFCSETNFFKSGVLYEPVRDTTAGNNTMRISAATYEATAAITRFKVAGAAAAKLKVGCRLVVKGY